MTATPNPSQFSAHSQSQTKHGKAPNGEPILVANDYTKPSLADDEGTQWDDRSELEIDGNLLSTPEIVKADTNSYSYHHAFADNAKVANKKPPSLHGWPAGWEADDNYHPILHDPRPLTTRKVPPWSLDSRIQDAAFRRLSGCRLMHELNEPIFDPVKTATACTQTQFIADATDSMKDSCFGHNYYREVNNILLSDNAASCMKTNN
ncbi:expressed unknown protein [Seminavis robusta]|uniref:Uncharacterized protein n=1 Tax=Seminavis robusta TaxID=568900 RepID=A0A9N8HK92_9STRA|nr:expressed unknown protein [Seminavis robusta]|eukprot:Sro739_g195450.1 n/a (206) ;mRNA; f:47136-47753